MTTVALFFRPTRASTGRLKPADAACARLNGMPVWKQRGSAKIRRQNPKAGETKFRAETHQAISRSGSQAQGRPYV